MKTAVLRGPDHTTLGAVATVAEGPAAIALSRGGAPKLYAHRDPNEDAAAFALGAAGTLVVVADGHSGHEAADAALAYLLEVHAADWTEGASRAEATWREAVWEALAGANGAILAIDVADRRRRPRTTLALALVRPADGLLVVASVGDSHVFHATDRTVADLGGDPGTGAFFLGHEPETPASLAAKAWAEVRPVAGTRAVVLATDGLSEVGVGVVDPEAAVADALDAAAASPPERRARDAAWRVMEIALDAQRHHEAGDNVAVGVVWVGADEGQAQAR